MTEISQWEIAIDNFRVPNLLEELLEKEPTNIKEAFGVMLNHISSLESRLQYIHDLIPTKYKKFLPKPGENPYFNVNINHNATSKEDYEQAKIRMKSLLECSKNETN